MKASNEALKNISPTAKVTKKKGLNRKGKSWRSGVLAVQYE
jgi:hypothetical protein